MIKLVRLLLCTACLLSACSTVDSGAHTASEPTALTAGTETAQLEQQPTATAAETYDVPTTGAATSTAVPAPSESQVSAPAPDKGNKASNTDNDDFEISASPLSELLGLPVTDTEIYRNELERLTNRAEHTTRCMRKQGYDDFRFFAREVIAPARAATSESNNTGYFGITRSLDAHIQALKTGEFLGPAPILERESYFFLNGQEFSWVDIADQLGDQSDQFHQNLSTCRDASQQKYPTNQLFLPEEEIGNEIADALLYVNQTLAQSNVWDDWSTCMHNEGYPVFTQQDLAAPLQMESDSVLQEIMGLFHSGANESTPEIDRRIEALREQEKLLSATNQRCMTETNVEVRLADECFELETQLVEANGDRWYLAILEARKHSD